MCRRQLFHQTTASAASFIILWYFDASRHFLCDWQSGIWGLHILKEAISLVFSRAGWIESGKSICIWASLVAQAVKNLPAVRETQVRSLSWEDPLEKGMATHSSILAWRIPWTEQPAWLQSIGSQRVGQDWTTNTFTFLMLMLRDNPECILDALG